MPYDLHHLLAMTKWLGTWSIIQNLSAKIKAEDARKNALQKLFNAGDTNLSSDYIARVWEFFKICAKAEKFYLVIHDMDFYRVFNRDYSSKNDGA